MEVTFSTQMLGTLLFFLSLGGMTYKTYVSEKKLKSNWFKGFIITVTAGFIITYIWNPVKLVTPNMSDIEYQEKKVLVVPPKVVVGTKTLEQEQQILVNKAEEK